MKTITDFLKSKTFIIIVAVILLISLFSIKQCQRKVLIEKINTLEVTNLGLNQDRIGLENQLKALQTDYAKIVGSNDSLKIVLAKYQKELKDLIKAHAKEIQDLLAVPPDTVYKRLTDRFPNYDNTDQRFRFASSQIIPIYSTVISFGMVKQEYSLQTKSLNACLGLNAGYETGIANLNKQVTNLQDNINKADSQIKNYNKEVALLNKQINKKAFWNKTLIGAGAVAVLIAVIK